MKKSSMVFFAILLTKGTTALACSCPPTPSPPSFSTTITATTTTKGAIFLGRVLKVVTDPSTDSSRIHLSVIRAWHGVSAPEVWVSTPSTHGLCGYPFQEGVSYLVYADVDAEGGLSTGICTRTRTEAQAVEDIKELNKASGQ